ncbi:TM0106 family RecB-like putative nuclease [Anabaena aphanizomenioides LEGE 00250]|uniref:TM0106 family RecB-like putative nuclease n=1 Tax=Sphaerospermopsis aphanizomenoides LEGE 00250 TaxID=2777972 RepID=A0ABR9VL27_9CYAN|nr:TM0106 family RecB-like putative nuclease [Sphaerospermopsis aphanizomenoides]MBE9238352.1 TM0106 family RecB-like putative nuclease [Sphaerospermopsis aphanizomenoides LEGE 00250]
MIINAELLLQYQRCKRRPFLDTHGDYSQRDIPHELLVKVQQDKIAHQKSIIYNLSYHKPVFPPGNWEAGAAATIELMQQGVEYIHNSVLLATYEDEYTLLSRPDLLVKQPGKSSFGDWVYIPVDIQLGKRPKQEYQVIAAFHAEILGALQEVTPDEAWLILRNKDTTYVVDLDKWTPQMLDILAEYIQVVESPEAPEVFIARQKCHLCHWYNHCYAIAQSQQHLSLLPGVTPIRYTQLQSLSTTTLEALANTNPSTLENVIGFDTQVASKLIVQAKSTLAKTPLILPFALPAEKLTFTAPIELYFDIEAQPDLNLNYLLGVLVVDRENNTEKFYSFLAETPTQENLIWQQFLDLVCQYPQAPIYHFCNYEVETVKKLGKLYCTPYSLIEPLLTRFVDIYEQLTESVALPIESYALKAIARWLGFEWRDQEASGAKCIYWYDQWLETGDRHFLELIQRYNEDDCRATRKVKDWLVNFFQTEYTRKLA